MVFTKMDQVSGNNHIIIGSQSSIFHPLVCIYYYTIISYFWRTVALSITGFPYYDSSSYHYLFYYQDNIDCQPEPLEQDEKQSKNWSLFTVKINLESLVKILVIKWVYQAIKASSSTWRRQFFSSSGLVQKTLDGYISRS